MPEVDDYERAVLLRSRRVGLIWCGFGALGLTLGATSFLFMLLELRAVTGTPNPLFLLALVAWVAISTGAARSGWRSFHRANAALGGTTLPETELDEGLS